MVDIDRIINSWNQYAFTKPLFRGAGSQWKVYEVEFLLCIQNIYGYKKHSILKISHGGNVVENIKRFNVLMKTGIPTLEVYESFPLFPGVIVTDDINYDYENNVKCERVYISPNTIRNMKGTEASDKEISLLFSVFEMIGANKICQLENFEEFIDGFKRDAACLAVKHIILPDDSFFFGVKAESEGTVSVDYKIADFDLIYADELWKEEDDESPEFVFYLNKNLLAMYDALWVFYHELCSDNTDNKHDMEWLVSESRKLSNELL